jgi:hypothetical protein
MDRLGVFKNREDGTGSGRSERMTRRDMGIEGAGVVMARRDLGPSIRGRIHCRDRFERQWALMARRIRDLVSQPSIRGRWWREVRGRCGRDAGRDCGSGNLPSAGVAGAATFHPRALLARCPGSKRPRGRRRDLRERRGSFAELARRQPFAGREAEHWNCARLHWAHIE